MKRNSRRPPEAIADGLRERLLGQDPSIDTIARYVRRFQAGLSPEGRPAGIFFLLGPTGTGKTRTVEALAEVLHGSKRNLLRVDCAEYQSDHEIAKLIGAPPGYLGHRETHPVLTQSRLSTVTSEHSSLSLVLFDEVEKAGAGLRRLLLGVMDKATLRLGDNNLVSFERSLIFFTSNVGAREQQEVIAPAFGFAGGAGGGRPDGVALNALRREFSPEFLNRIDETAVYRPLSRETAAGILDLEITAFQRRLDRRLGARAFRVDVPPRVRRWLLEVGFSAQYGAREIRRVIERYVADPVSDRVMAGKTVPGGVVRVEIPDSRRAA